VFYKLARKAAIRASLIKLAQSPSSTPLLGGSASLPTFPGVNSYPSSYWRKFHEKYGLPRPYPDQKATQGSNPFIPTQGSVDSFVSELQRRVGENMQRYKGSPGTIPPVSGSGSSGSILDITSAVGSLLKSKYNQGQEATPPRRYMYNPEKGDRPR